MKRMSFSTLTLRKVAERSVSEHLEDIPVVIL